MFQTKVSREKKRIIIIFIYCGIVVLIGCGLYLALKPAPTCFDEKQNQGEEGIDCGGPCAACEKEIVAEDIQIKEKVFAYGGFGKYDVLVKIYNPNNHFGSPSFNYCFILKDESGDVLSERAGKNFILPGEEKYLIETNLETSARPDNVALEISNVSWEKLLVYEKPAINIYNKKFTKFSGGPVYGEVFGILRNESDFDFDVIKINVVLRDMSGQALSFNTTQMKTVISQEERDFRLIWPFGFSREVYAVEAEAQANVYDSQNFIKQYLPGGKFQEYN